MVLHPKQRDVATLVMHLRNISSFTKGLSGEIVALLELLGVLLLVLAARQHVALDEHLLEAFYAYIYIDW